MNSLGMCNNFYIPISGGGVIYYMKTEVLESNFQTQIYYFQRGGGG